MRTLLLGMGNPILCDDAVGVRLARDFQQQLSGIPGLEIVAECPLGGLNLLDVLEGYETVIVLDAMMTAQGEPGDWCHFTAAALRESLNLTSIHDANFATVLHLGRRLGMELPESENIHIFAVKAVKVLDFSDRMTPELELRYPEYSSAILAAIRALIG